jgi:hypothetical protein
LAVYSTPIFKGSGILRHKHGSVLDASNIIDGRIVAAARRYGKSLWTSLNWLDLTEGKLAEFLALPSKGDTGYAGICWHDDVLWISYYSSHEERTSIYLAKARL